MFCDFRFSSAIPKTMVFWLLFVGAGFIPARNRLEMHRFSGGDKPRHYGKMEFPDAAQLII